MKYTTVKVAQLFIEHNLMLQEFQDWSKEYSVSQSHQWSSKIQPICSFFVGQTYFMTQTADLIWTSMWWDFYKGNTDSPDILGLRQRWWNSPVLLTHHLFQTSVFFWEKFDQQLRLGPIQFTLHPNEVVSKQDFFFRLKSSKSSFSGSIKLVSFFFQTGLVFSYIYIYTYLFYILKIYSPPAPDLLTL